MFGDEFTHEMLFYKLLGTGLNLNCTPPSIIFIHDLLRITFDLGFGMPYLCFYISLTIDKIFMLSILFIIAYSGLLMDGNHFQVV